MKHWPTKAMISANSWIEMDEDYCAVMRKKVRTIRANFWPEIVKDG
jgi:hypothetical protein